MPAALTDLLGSLRLRVRRVTRRRRRPIAALLTALAALVALTSIRSPTPTATPPTSSTSMTSTIESGEVAVPIVLPNAGILRTVSEGQLVDIARVPRDESQAASIVVHGARIIDIPDGGSTFSATSTPVVVVAVSEPDALPLVATGSRDSIALVIRPFGNHR